MQLGRFLLKRLLYAVPLFFFAVTLIFVLIRLAPGDPVDYMLGEMGGDPEFVERMRRDLGLDQPIYVQLVKYVRQVATGNLGFSFASNAPVLALILDRFPCNVHADDHAVRVGGRHGHRARRAVGAAAEFATSTTRLPCCRWRVSPFPRSGWGK